MAKRSGERILEDAMSSTEAGSETCLGAIPQPLERHACLSLAHVQEVQEKQSPSQSNDTLCPTPAVSLRISWDLAMLLGEQSFS